MKHVLVKHQDLKLLVNEGSNANALISHMDEVKVLNKKVKLFYENILAASQEEGRQLDIEKQNLISKIGYRVIGVPFTNQDAELYALDKSLSYTVLELT